MLSAEQKREWNERGFFIIRGFADEALCRAMLDRVVEITRLDARGGHVDNVVVMPEKKENSEAREPEEFIAKVFRLHRDSVFKEFVERKDLLDLISGIIGPEIDCFLSQFIFKNRGAMGQPWHQDSFYFPFDKTPQVGVWLAVTKATLENGCLHVVPGSHQEPVHAHGKPRRPESLYGYMEILDYDMSSAVQVLMEPG